MHHKIDCPVQLTLPLLCSHDESFRVGIFIYCHFLCAILTLIAASKVTIRKREILKDPNSEGGGVPFFFLFSFRFLYRSFIDIHDLKRKKVYIVKEREREGEEGGGEIYLLLCSKKQFGKGKQFSGTK